MSNTSKTSASRNPGESKSRTTNSLSGTMHRKSQHGYKESGMLYSPLCLRKPLPRGTSSRPCYKSRSTTTTRCSLYSRRWKK
ncbi:hypothetical protein BJX96DRAFT_141590 [Aspergillus floccosus]